MLDFMSDEEDIWGVDVEDNELFGDDEDVDVFDNDLFGDGEGGISGDSAAAGADVEDDEVDGDNQDVISGDMAAAGSSGEELSEESDGDADSDVRDESSTLRPLIGQDAIQMQELIRLFEAPKSTFGELRRTPEIWEHEILAF
jgi:hypothetical protein